VFIEHPFCHLSQKRLNRQLKQIQGQSMSSTFLSEGISHIEDLPLEDFISVLNRLSDLKGLEKVDGAQLWIGVDDDGQFYTSREGKRSAAIRYYSPDEWPKIADFNQFRAAHIALSNIETDIKKVLFPGATVEIEVLFGAQPNTVNYGGSGNSYLVILRGAAGTPDNVADELAASLANQKIDTEVEVVSSNDGIELIDEKIRTTFQIVSPQKIDLEKLKSEQLLKSLKDLEDFLNQKSEIKQYTNKELASVNLSSVKTDSRELVKAARSAVLAKIDSEYKADIKRALLDRSASLKSSLGDANLEGIVFRDPNTNEQVKLVNKDEFLITNRFNQSMRDIIRGPLMTTDENASLEAQGGLTGHLRIRIAKFLGEASLAKAATMKKKLAELGGDSKEEVLSNLENYFEIKDFQQTKRKILLMISATKKELDSKLDDFKKNKDKYELKLKSGKVVKLSDEVFKKTLTIFAETRKSFISQFNKIKGTNNSLELLDILYGHLIGDNSPIQEAKKHKASSYGEVDLQNAKNLDGFHILNSYLSILMMSIILLKENDTKARRLLRDQKNMHLKKWNYDMSPLNHWGYIIWSANRKDVKSVLNSDAEKVIARMTQPIPKLWWNMLHMDLSTDLNRKIDWKSHHFTIKQLIDFSGFRSKKLNYLIRNAFGWDQMTFDEKVKYLGELYMHALRFTPRSLLLNRFKHIQTNIIMGNSNLNLLAEVSKIKEDGDAASTSAGDIASVPTKLFANNDKKIIKRVRNPELFKMFMKFKKGIAK
jgi:hypothetical protein